MKLDSMGCDKTMPMQIVSCGLNLVCSSIISAMTKSSSFDSSQIDALKIDAEAFLKTWWNNDDCDDGDPSDLHKRSLNHLDESIPRNDLV